MAMAAAAAAPRSLTCHYNPVMVTGAIVVSLLGAFTSTQLMSQARGARSLSGALIWTVLGCLTFGFCGVWCLHFLAMLSCEFDVHIGLEPLPTIFSAVLAVTFTFGALSTDLVGKYVQQIRQKNIYSERRTSQLFDDYPDLGSHPEVRDSSEPLLRSSFELLHAHALTNAGVSVASGPPEQSTDDGNHKTTLPLTDTNHDYNAPSHRDAVTHQMQCRASCDFPCCTSDATQIDSPSQPKRTGNLLVLTAVGVYHGLSLPNVAKGFVWSIALTNMHFMGVRAIKVSGGSVILDPARVVLCGLVSWSVCCVAVVAMAGMEVNIQQQLLFSAIAATGVAAVHLSGMFACSFWSTEAPESEVGYPRELPIVIASVAIFTCMVSTGLLAHSATVARDKLAEVLYTRRRLWAAIAQKDNAEAAAASRSEFITSASHEIRTPLHQLQGYADLLSESELPEEGRRLLHAIQLATRSLAMITSNVLDWSRLESGEAVCRPVAVDIRLACEAVVHVLPNNEDNVDTELLVVISPEVPGIVLVDETYLQRILMNLLSNSFKFTAAGYVTLLVRVADDNLCLTVEDTGRGIPRSFLPQLFEPYKQVQARGAERGTGLGLSITKRLLEKMRGSISVDSKCLQDQGVGIANCGSVFALTIPLALSEGYSSPLPFQLLEPLRIAIMHEGKDRSLEGLTAAWRSIGAEISPARASADIPTHPDTIIWADLNFLQKNHDVRADLLTQQQHIVLLPYKDPAALKEVLGSTPAPNIVPIRKPLIWHRIVQSINAYRHAQSIHEVSDVARVETANPVVPIATSKDTKETNRARKRTILLVEDNKINQTLGAKMLTNLKYDVLLADDGQEAIEIVMEHGQAIDAILMDQSMPRKDGITATREIRALEASGLLPNRQIIIAVTAAAGPEAQEQFLEAGTDMFLSKPLSLLKLKQTLSHYLGG